MTSCKVHFFSSSTNNLSKILFLRLSLYAVCNPPVNIDRSINLRCDYYPYLFVIVVIITIVIDINRDEIYSRLFHNFLFTTISMYDIRMITKQVC
jgi:hypothetical protein